MHEVSAVVVRAALGAAKEAGLPVEELVAGLPFDAESLRHLRRVAWDDYATIAERMEAACGSPERLERLLSDGYHSSWPPEIRSLLGAFVTPRRLARFMLTVANPRMFRCVDVRYEESGNDRIRVAFQLRPGARPCLAWFRGSVGAFRGLPHHLGLPEAEVDIVELTGTTLDCRVRFPPSRSIGTRSAAALRDSALFLIRLLGEDSRVDSERIAHVLQLGRELSRHIDLPSLAEALVAMLRSLGWSRVALYVEPASGGPQVQCANIGSAPIVRSFALEARARAVGRLDVGGSGDATLLAELVPWLSIAVENARSFAAIPRVVGNDRLEAARASLDLSERQRDVLARVLRGLSNKEIAAELACAENTVEHHLTGLFRKMDVASRTQVIATFFARY